MVRKKLLVQNETGLHLRPAGHLCEIAGKYSSQILFLHAGAEINAKSVLSVLAAGIQSGDEVELQCTGADEEEAAAAIEQLFADRFVPRA